jgi:hypothetical protein
MEFKNKREMKYLEKYSNFFDRFEEYEKAKNSPEYKALIDDGFIDITTDRQRRNGTFAFETPLRHMKYGIYNTYYGRANIDFRHPSPLWKNDNLQSYEECFKRLKKTEEKGKIGFTEYAYNKTEKSHYIKKLTEFLKKRKANIWKINYFPTISEHTELEELYRGIYQDILDKPTMYLTYYKYIEDDELYSNSGYEINVGYNDIKKYLSTDILDWLSDPEIIEQQNQKIIKKVEEDPKSWYDNAKKWNLLPDAVKDELNWVSRGVKSGMWSLKTN